MGAFLAFLVMLGFVIFLFYIFREAVCWYWKINESVELQRGILKELERLNAKTHNTSTKLNASEPGSVLSDEILKAT